MYYIQNLFGHPVVINEWRLLIKRSIENKATKKSQSQPKAAGKASLMKLLSNADAVLGFPLFAKLDNS